MGMADPRAGLFQMTCCGTFTSWIPPKEGGRWEGNWLFEVDVCPNPGCPTRRATPVPTGEGTDTP